MSTGTSVREIPKKKFQGGMSQGVTDLRGHLTRIPRDTYGTGSDHTGSIGRIPSIQLTRVIY